MHLITTTIIWVKLKIFIFFFLVPLQYSGSSWVKILFVLFINSDIYCQLYFSIHDAICSHQQKTALDRDYVTKLIEIKNWIINKGEIFSIRNYLFSWLIRNSITLFNRYKIKRALKLKSAVMLLNFSLKITFFLKFCHQKRQHQIKLWHLSFCVT